MISISVKPLAALAIVLGFVRTQRLIGQTSFLEFRATADVKALKMKAFP
jgi:hypothetical protein